MQLSRRDFVHAGCAIGAASLVPSIVDRAEAGINNPGAVPTAIVGASGRSVQVSGSDAEFWFKNFMLNSGGLSGSTSTDQWPGLLNANQYPKATGSLATAISWSVNLDHGYAGNYVLSWSGQGTVQAGRGTPGFTVVSDPGGVVLGGTGFNLLARSNAGTTRLVFGMPRTIAATISNASPAVAAAGVVPSIGTKFRFTTTGTLPSPLSTSTDYFVIASGYVANTSFQFSATQFGSAIATTTAGSGTHSIPCIPSSITFNYSFGEVFDGAMANLTLCRCDAPYGTNGTVAAGDELDIAASQAGDLSRMFNQDSIAKYTTLNPKVLRFTGWENINFSNVSQHATRTPVGAAFYTSPRFDPTLWVGTISGSNSIYSCSGGSATPGTFTDGEQIQGQFTNAQVSLAPSAISNTTTVVTFTVASTANLTTGQNAFINAPGLISAGVNGILATFPITVTSGTQFTITGAFTGAYTSGAKIWPQPTINVATRGAKPIVNVVMNVSNDTFDPASLIPALNNCTLTYDKVFDSWIVDVAPDQGALGKAAGLSACPPVEVLVALCNKLRKDAWIGFPGRMSTTEAVAKATYVRDHLASGLNAHFEYGNENWNPGFTMLQYCLNHGIKLGWAVGSNVALYGYWSLRMAQIFNGIGAIWSGGAGLRRMIAAQGAADGTTDTYLLSGTQLNAASAGALYTTLGFADYSVTPNRPWELCDHFSYATYYGSSQAMQFPANYIDNGANSTTIASLLTQADNYATGVAGNITTALDWFDNSVRRGTMEPLAASSVAADGTFTFSTDPTLRQIFQGSLVQLFTTGTLPASSPQWVPTIAGSGVGSIGGSAQIYYVVNQVGNTFQLSATRGGAAIGSVSGGSGTISVGAVIQTLLMWSTDRLNFWNALGVKYSKTIVCYEGGHSSWYPLEATCTSIGISTTYSQKILNLIEGYKRDDRCKQMVLDQKTQFMLGSKSLLPCELQVVGNNAWSLLDGYVQADETQVSTFNGDLLNVATFKSWDACVQWNN